MEYLDTSMLVPYYCAEPFSARVQMVMGALNDPTISPLVELEFHAAFAMKVRTREMPAELAGQTLSRFQMHVNDGLYRIVPVTNREYAVARTWLNTFAAPLRTLDALHLATAYTGGMTLISADKSLIRCAREFGVKHQMIS